EPGERRSVGAGLDREPGIRIRLGDRRAELGEPRAGSDDLEWVPGHLELAGRLVLARRQVDAGELAGGVLTDRVERVLDRLLVESGRRQERRRVRVGDRGR